MANGNFKHTDPDSFHDKELTLHDCAADKITFENKKLRFFLPDGFWITPRHKENPSDKTVRTDASAVDFSVEDIDDVLVCVFKRYRWPCRGKTSVEYWGMKKLVSDVNCGKYTIEFVTQYRSCHGQMWQCAIHSEKKSYYMDCQLHLPETSAAFHWNDLRFDREW